MCSTVPVGEGFSMHRETELGFKLGRSGTRDFPSSTSRKLKSLKLFLPKEECVKIYWKTKQQ